MGREKKSLFIINVKDMVYYMVRYTANEELLVKFQQQ